MFASGTPSQSTSLFRVWSSDYDDPDAAPEALMRTVRAAPPPLTPAAAKARAAWDPAKNAGFAGCAPKGMPFIMAQPFPLEFVDKGDSIEVRIEEYDVVRTIHMNPQRSVSAGPATSEGHSVGRWESNTLVVTTSNITARPFDDSGFMRSAAANVVERFTPSADGSRLHYTVTLTDPEVFTRPMELKRSWVWRPGEKVMPFNCAP